MPDTPPPQTAHYILPVRVIALVVVIERLSLRPKPARLPLHRPSSHCEEGHGCMGPDAAISSATVPTPIRRAPVAPTESPHPVTARSLHGFWWRRRSNLNGIHPHPRRASRHSPDGGALDPSLRGASTASCGGDEATSWPCTATPVIARRGARLHVPPTTQSPSGAAFAQGDCVGAPAVKRAGPPRNGRGWGNRRMRLLRRLHQKPWRLLAMTGRGGLRRIMSACPAGAGAMPEEVASSPRKLPRGSSQWLGGKSRRLEADRRLLGHEHDCAHGHQHVHEGSGHGRPWPVSSEHASEHACAQGGLWPPRARVDRCRRSTGRAGRCPTPAVGV